MNVYEAHTRFIDLFGGYADSKAIGAYGTGTGRWIKRPLSPQNVVDHLAGVGPGIGVPPLRPDNTVVFAAIDLDEPDFEAARQMQSFLPGTSFLERSRSGNAHVWVFFESPIEAWIVMALLKEATVAAGKNHVEVFPKNHDFARVKLGNYINLPYHGKERPVVASSWEDTSDWDPTGVEVECEWPLSVFIEDATTRKNDPEAWRRRADWLMIEPPEVRESSNCGDKQSVLHICAEYIIGGALSGERPIREGHRAAVYFALAKMLRNCEYMDDVESLNLLRECNTASPDSLPDRELRRIFDNAANFRSTGCDDVLVQPFTHPDCKIARS